MAFVSQTLSLVGMICLAAMLLLLVQGVTGAGMNWIGLAGTLVLAGACFWGAAWIKGRG